ncbi:hypothetical protein CDD80_4239 [Ophiocordyceps camponoti-rufipedis]|uniref:Uncharacterized protein n=1 Tax=Ophiocordyceps camponoti-rufipedis TaxID=2004952 RepID=A0A2C5ZJP1_9HYPO|nr:hypothetical protein CDD80_4239 [Ophiocordyceps camponoti-rufipedis]
MRLIINALFALEPFDCTRLAKYLRCLLQAILPLDDALALQIADEALRIAHESEQAGLFLPSSSFLHLLVKRPFPKEELEWLVATSFNHAVDLYARADEKACHEWALKAMALARFAGDGGCLAALLAERFSKLKFGG